MLLLKGFNDGLGVTEEDRRGGAVMGRPWSWVYDEAEMAGALGEVLRGMDVQAPEGVGFAGRRKIRLRSRGGGGSMGSGIIK